MGYDRCRYMGGLQQQVCDITAFANMQLCFVSPGVEAQATLGCFCQSLPVDSLNFGSQIGPLN